MDLKPLESARTKLAQASLRVNELQSELSVGMNTTYGFSFIHASDTDELIIRAMIPRDVFIHFSVAAGEVIHHARSALDHAIWDLVPEPIDHVTGLPVRRDRQKYQQDAARMMSGINPAAETIVRGLQPFGDDYQDSRLYLLNELWNIDKHRLLNLCAFYPYGGTIYYRRDELTR